MEIALSKAKARLSELAARADGGEDVTITRRGKNPIRLVSEKRKRTPEEKRAVLDRYRGALKGRPGMDGVTSENISDFLFDERGLPA